MYAIELVTLGPCHHVVARGDQYQEQYEIQDVDVETTSEDHDASTNGGDGNRDEQPTTMRQATFDDSCSHFNERENHDDEDFGCGERRTCKHRHEQNENHAIRRLERAAPQRRTTDLVADNASELDRAIGAETLLEPAAHNGYLAELENSRGDDED